jgi:hypothetical protein
MRFHLSHLRKVGELRHDLLALLVKNEIVARCLSGKFLKANLSRSEIARGLEPDETPIVVTFQYVELTV